MIFTNIQAYRRKLKSEFFNQIIKLVEGKEPGFLINQYSKKKYFFMGFFDPLPGWLALLRPAFSVVS
jgi:hypothetical protein